MLQKYAVAFGAGCAAAFLFAVSAQASALAMALAYFSPLPLLIGALGFSALGALAGALLGVRTLGGGSGIADDSRGRQRRAVAVREDRRREIRPVADGG